MKDEEIDLLIDYKTKRARFIASKAGDDREEYLAAKKDYSEFRRYWRGIRDAFGAPAPAPATIASAATVNEGK